MTKQSGIGGNLYLGGYDLSGDVGVINAVRDSGNLFEVTGIDKGAVERIPGLADGEISFTAFFNDAALAAHAALKARGSGDKHLTYAVGTTLGKAGAALVGKQVDYAGARGADGSIAFSVQAQSADGEGLRWGQMLTAGKRTDAGATNGGTVDGGAAAPTAFGAVLFLHVFAFSGTNVTVKVQDSANGTDWLDLSGAAFAQITTAPTSERIALGAAATVRRYLRAITETAGGFSSVQFAVLACRRYA